MYCVAYKEKNHLYNDINMELDSATRAKGANEQWFSSLLLEPVQNQPVPILLLYAPRRNSCLCKIGRLMGLCVMLQRCPLKELYLEDWVNSLLISEKREGCGGG